MEAKKRVKKPAPPQTPLVAAWHEGGLENAFQHIQNSLAPEYRTQRDPEARSEYKAFGVLFGKAMKANNPELLAGFKPKAVDWSRAGARWGDGVFQCQHCMALGYYDRDDSNTPTDENERWVCKACIPNFVRSTIQECWIPREGAVPVRVGANEWSVATPRFATRSCPRVRNEYASPEYAEELRTLTRGQPKEYDEGENPFDPRVHGVSGYHSSKEYTEKLPSPIYDRHTPSLLVGIELEIEVASRGERDVESREAAAKEVKALFNGPNGEEHYALTENDGSISWGFEVVTGWTGLDTHERILSRMRSPEFQEIVKTYGMRSHDTTTCGLHVTIDRAGMTPLHRGKFQVFLNAPLNKEWLDKICRRAAARYAKIKHEKFAKVSSGAQKMIRAQEADRYEIANFHGNKHAIEFRGPKGTLRFETIMATMEFIRLVWMFTKQASMKDLTAGAFMDFVWKREHAFESQYLRAYMLERKIAPEEHIELPTKRRFTVQESLVDASAMGFIACSKDL